MKKFLFGFLALALIASNAFAELTLSGLVGGVVTPISIAVGEDGDAGKPQASGSMGNARLFTTFANDDGSFGGFIHWMAEPDWQGSYDSSRYWAWWKPLDQFKLTIGQDAWGAFDNRYIVAWGFHANDAEDYVAYNGYGFTRSTGWYSGFTAFGAQLAITPIEGLAINIGIPYSSGLAENSYKQTHAQLAYKISGIGEFAVTYIGGLGDTVTPPIGGGYVGTTSNGGAIQAQFYLGEAVPNLGVNLGFKYNFAVEQNDIKHEKPMEIGLGVSYAISDTMGIKARFSSALAGQVSYKDQAGKDAVYKEGFHMGFDLEPYFDLGMMKLFVNLGFEYKANDDNAGAEIKNDQPLEWYVNPYITKSAAGGTFYAGIEFRGKPDDSDNRDHIVFALPIGLQVTF